MAKRRVNADQLAKAAALFGNTVLDPSAWSEVMEKICLAAGATGAMLLQGGARTFDVPRTPSFDEALRHYFSNSFHLKDIRAARAVPLLMSGTSVVFDQDMMTAEEMRSDPMYNETLLPFGFQWFAGVGFWADSALWGLCLQRTIEEGPFAEADRKEFAALSRRMSEVATLSTAVGRTVLASATNALNAVCQPAIAIDRSGFVLDANVAAQTLLDDQFCIRNRRIFVKDRQANGCLKELIDRIQILSDAAALTCEPIVVRRKRGGPVIIRVLPVHPAARTPFLGARVILTLTPTEVESRPDPALLSQAFGLTPAEAKLASIVCEGVSPQRAAEQLGISRETARNQLKAVFAKTATHRQSELVALLSRF
jgi:DNA-binding CsgD family transcriptional regulator